MVFCYVLEITLCAILLAIYGSKRSVAIVPFNRIEMANWSARPFGGRAFFRRTLSSFSYITTKLLDVAIQLANSAVLARRFAIRFLTPG